MNIHQVCVSYVKEQDRFLVRINTSGEAEVRLWLTRRLTLGLLPLLEKAANNQQVHLAQQAPQARAADLAAPLHEQRQRMLDSFRQEAAAYSGDYQTPYREQAALLPLGAEPLLVTEIKITALDAGNLLLEVLEKLTDDSRSVQIKMDAQLTRGLIALLNQGLRTSQWLDTDIAVTVKGNAPQPQADADAMATTLPTDKPRYLN